MSSKLLPALDVKNVSHLFGLFRALDEVSICVEQGQICTLLGLNGAGKTTLFSLITRLYNSTSGEIAVLGLDMRRHSRAALAHLGVVFQNRTVDADLSVMENLTYHGALYGMSRKQARINAERELERIGLLDRRTEKIRALSGGQARRVEIARAFMHAPRLLLLDEPTIGLDVASREAIRAHIRGLVNDEGIGVLWATHLFDEVEAGDHTWILHTGKVRAGGEVSRLIKEIGGTSIADVFAHHTGMPTTIAEEASQ